MTEIRCPMTGEEMLDAYFLDNRARLLEVAAFLDRIERSGQSRRVKQDRRYQALMMGLERLSGSLGSRTWAIQMIFSDLSSESTAADVKASGAPERLSHEDY